MRSNMFVKVFSDRTGIRTDVALIHFSLGAYLLNTVILDNIIRVTKNEQFVEKRK